ncbi:MAG TPA: glutathione S-transferase family protein [Candidatus Binataceae bacterium]|nr:glutathione S-transferase family protein [Candidatus Binataceae bacterium]
MGTLNLYQYPISPFTEKLRRVLIYKGIKWNPIDCHFEDKTNLLAITKGQWTRVPVVEWDGEVVWNSADIIRWIDKQAPERPVIPADARGLCDIIDLFADNQLFPSILFLVIPDLLEAAGDPKLKANREKLIGMTTEQMRMQQPACRETLKSHCAMIDKQVASQDFFLGKNFTMADASLYHPFFFLALNPGNFAKVAEFTHLMRWYERVRAIA